MGRLPLHGPPTDRQRRITGQRGAAEGTEWVVRPLPRHGLLPSVLRAQRSGRSPSGPRGAVTRALILDVLMLTVTGGRERTPAQPAELFGAAGFRLTKVIPTGGPLHLVEATAI